MDAVTESHWQNLKAERDPIDAARFARVVESGLTKHSDLATVQAAREDWCDARDEYVAAYRAGDEAIDAIVSPEDRRRIAWQRYAPPQAVAIDAVMHDAHEMTTPARRPGWRSYSEHYPLSRWAKEAACFRRWAAKIRAAVDAARRSQGEESQP